MATFYNTPKQAIKEFSAVSEDPWAGVNIISLSDDFLEYLERSSANLHYVVCAGDQAVYQYECISEEDYNLYVGMITNKYGGYSNITCVKFRIKSGDGVPVLILPLDYQYEMMCSKLHKDMLNDEIVPMNKGPVFKFSDKTPIYAEPQCIVGCRYMGTLSNKFGASYLVYRADDVELKKILNEKLKNMV